MLFLKRTLLFQITISSIVVCVANADLKCFDCFENCYKVDPNKAPVLCDEAENSACVSYYFKSKDTSRTAVYRECLRGDKMDACLYAKQLKEEDGEVVNCEECKYDLCNDKEYNNDGTIKNITLIVPTKLNRHSNTPGTNKHMNGKNNNPSIGNKLMAFPLIPIIFIISLGVLYLC